MLGDLVIADMQQMLTANVAIACMVIDLVSFSQIVSARGITRTPEAQTNAVPGSDIRRWTGDGFFRHAFCEVAQADRTCGKVHRMCGTAARWDGLVGTKVIGEIPARL